MNECKPLAGGADVSAERGERLGPHPPQQGGSSGLHSFPFQLHLSSLVHRITQLSSQMCPGVAQVVL
jgi:hypothetical protein